MFKLKSTFVYVIAHDIDQFTVSANTAEHVYFFLLFSRLCSVLRGVACAEVLVMYSQGMCPLRI